MIGDVATILLFCAGGIVSHHESGALLEEMFRVAAPFLVGYGFAASILGAWKWPVENGKDYAKRLLGAWFWGVSMGVLIRIALEARLPIPSFFAVAYGVTGLLLALWRGLNWYFCRHKSEPGPS